MLELHHLLDHLNQLSLYFNYFSFVSICDTAAQIDADALHTLSREDLRDLFPGPEHFLRRKSIWKVVHPVV